MIVLFNLLIVIVRVLIYLLFFFVLYRIEIMRTIWQMIKKDGAKVVHAEADRFVSLLTTQVIIFFFSFFFFFFFFHYYSSIYSCLSYYVYQIDSSSICSTSSKSTITIKTLQIHIKFIIRNLYRSTSC